MASPFRTLLAAEVAVLGALTAWLGAAAWLVEVDYFDGFDTVANSRQVLGLAEGYIANRAPLMAWLLAPAEWIRTQAGLHPLDLRPHHLTTALLHAAYLIAVYAALARAGGRDAATLIAFGAAVPTFVFFTYAPFISHDIAPGALLLFMVLLSNRFAERPSPRIAIALVALGAAAALVKQTFALFWIVVLVANAIVTALPGRVRDEGGGEAPAGVRALVGLGLAAAASALIVWVALAWTLSHDHPDAPWLLLPIAQIQLILGIPAESPLWVYLRNMPAYGWLTCALIVPGIATAIRGARRERLTAWSWLLSFALMHWLQFREVRYIAFLAPLSALLIAPVIRRIAARAAFAAPALAAIVVANVLYHAPEIVRIAEPFYSDSEIRAFLAPLEEAAGSERAVHWSGTPLSFPAPRSSGFHGDAYHRVFHFGVEHLRALYDLPGTRTAEIAPTADHVVLASALVTNDPGGPGRSSEAPHVQLLASARDTEVERQADGGYRDAARRALTVERVEAAEEPTVALAGPPIDEALSDALRVWLLAPGGPGVAPRADAAGRLVVPESAWALLSRYPTLALRRLAIEREERRGDDPARRSARLAPAP